MTDPITPKIEPVVPKTWKDFFIGIFWKDIDVEAGGGKGLRVNVIIFLIVIASIVGSLVILERAGVLDDIVSMIAKKQAAEHIR